MSATTTTQRMVIHVYTADDPRPAPFHPAPDEEATWLALLIHMHTKPGDRVEVVTDADSATGANGNAV